MPSFSVVLPFLSTPNGLWFGILCYVLLLAVCYGNQTIEGSWLAQNYRNLQQVSNVLVWLATCVVFVGFVRSTYGWMLTVSDDRFVLVNIDLWCDPDLVSYKHEHADYLFWLRANHALKFVEFVDTFWLIAKHARNKTNTIPFVHWFHHLCTYVLTWAHINYAFGAQWLPIFLNLCVHLVMYPYFVLAKWQRHQRIATIVASIRPWITRLQNGQFVVDLLFGMILFFHQLGADLAPSLQWLHCSGTLFYPVGILSLLLFVAYSWLFCHLPTRKKK